MLNQKLPHAPSEEMTIDIDLLYEMDPCELKLDEMIEAEPEPEMIEGLPASDALTPADRYLELFEHVQSSKLFADSKTFPDCAPKMDPLDILIRYRKLNATATLICDVSSRTISGYRKRPPVNMCPIRQAR